MTDRISRRRFLQLTSGAVIGASLTGLLAACGGDDDDTAPATSTTSGGGAPTATEQSTAAATSTTASGGGTPASASTPSASPSTTIGTPTVIRGTPSATGEMPEFGEIPEELKGEGEVVVVSFGGAFQEAQREAYFKPFEELTGIKVVEGEGPDYIKVKAMVDTGNIEWDVVLLSQVSGKTLLKQGDYWEPIDYSLVDVENIAEPFRWEYALDTLNYTHVLCYRTDTYNPGLTGWQDAWDPERFPGNRAFSTGGTGSAIAPLVPALIADGVPPDQLYPLDVDRAFDSLDKIKDHVIKWWDTEALPIQMLTDNEAPIVEASNGRMSVVQKDGVPVEIVWDGGQLMSNSWLIVKGAKNLTNAQKFIGFTSLPVAQARLALLIPYGFINARAADYLPPELLNSLPTAPQNLEKLIIYDSDWWVDNRPAVIERWNQWVLG